MRRRELSDEELDQVINLKRAGSSWVKIQRETGISRRTAKRAYDKWQRSKSLEELKEARKDVAAQAFREHMESVMTLAESLVTNLSALSSLADMEENTEQFFSSLWEQDLLRRCISSETHPLSYRREKELLFESLKVHTRDEIRWEDVLDNRWKKARDKCAEIVPQLQREASEVVNNLLNQEPNLLQSIKEGSGEGDPAKQMAETLLRVISKRILEDKLNQEGPWFETVSRADGKTHVVYVKPRDEIVRGFTDKSLAEKVTRICELVANNLREGNMVQQLHDEVPNMRKAAEELREMLNPVKLKPMILRTRCDLCPA